MLETILEDREKERDRQCQISFTNRKCIVNSIKERQKKLINLLTINGIQTYFKRKIQSVSVILHNTIFPLKALPYRSTKQH